MPPVSSICPAGHPFGTERERAERQHRWLEQRLTTIVPAEMRARGVDMWIVDMREYAEDPVFRALVAPETFAARRRSVFVFVERGGAGGGSAERLSLGGGSQGGLYTVVPSTRRTAEGRVAELGGSAEQWTALRALVEARHPARIALDTSPTFPLADGLTASEATALREALGPALSARFVP